MRTLLIDFLQQLEIVLSVRRYRDPHFHEGDIFHIEMGTRGPRPQIFMTSPHSHLKKRSPEPFLAAFYLPFSIPSVNLASNVALGCLHVE